MNLHHFKRSEFNRIGFNWFDKMNPELLYRLDCLRGIWQAPIHISKHPNAIGREREPKDTYDGHNFTKWGMVNAIDVFPSFPLMATGLELQAYDFLWHAEHIGFTGIGYYPQWNQGKLTGGFHLDVRLNPYQWGYVDDEFVSIEDVLK